MQITVTVDGACEPSRYLGELPIYVLGRDITLLGWVFNEQPQGFTIEDPRTSQQALLWFSARGRPQRIVFELNPGFMDATGERTAPITSDLTLVPGDSVSVPLRLWKHCADRCLVPGIYDVSLEHAGTASRPFALGIEFAAESVPILVAIALDEARDSWVRGQAMLLLRQVPGGPDLEPPAAHEAPAEHGSQENRNWEMTARFMQAWPQHALTAPVAKFFAKCSLK